MDARIEIREYGKQPVRHAHEFDQLVLPLVGALQFELGGCESQLVRGRAAWIPAGTAHGFHTRAASRFVTLDVPIDLSASLESRRLSNGELAPTHPRLERRAVRWARRVRSGAAAPDEAVRRVLFEFAADDARDSESRRRVAVAVARIDREPGRRYRTSELATSVGLRRVRFHDLFVAATGYTPAAYVAERRLQLAEQLLRQSSGTLAEIALTCGFSEQSALTRALSRERGITPALLRWRSGQDGCAGIS